MLINITLVNSIQINMSITIYFNHDREEWLHKPSLFLQTKKNLAQKKIFFAKQNS